ncbi:helix-turn-helix domain-containing protein [Longispora albida]|uniref:helix-turn-helix domain-containing protein n=1 Tax=Longispora albida TaxID=203523 RepID=UPI000368CFCE|nr:helix-turn-helix transcriptional regulator [Longispora albida]
MEDVGERVKLWRKRRGMTQRVLAGLAGMSQPYLSQIESGVRTVERRSTLLDLAKALAVSVSDLTGLPGDPTDPAKAKAAAAVPVIRAALVDIYGETARPTGRSSEQFAADVLAAGDLRAATDFAGLAPLLPDLLRDAYRYRTWLSHTAALSTSCLRALGYRDLAWQAADLAVRVAREDDDIARLGVAQFQLLQVTPVESSATAARIAQTARDELEPHLSNPVVRQAYGMLHLRQALHVAVTGGAGHQDHLHEASNLAASLGEPAGGEYDLLGFGPTNVGLWSMAVAHELGEPHRVIEIGRDVQPDRLPKLRGRQASYYLDLGKALAAIGGHEREAVVMVGRACHVAPQYVRVMPSARSAVASMITRAKRRAVADDLRSLASKMGIDA